MLKFKQFILMEEQAKEEQESTRKGLPYAGLGHAGKEGSKDHIRHMKGLLGDSGIVNINHVTEKTDGFTHEFGVDEKGFWTRYSGTKNRMYSADDYERMIEQKKAEGKNVNEVAARKFAEVHRTIESNKALIDHLRKKQKKTGKEQTVKGELLWRDGAQDSPFEGEKRFVGTSYSTEGMGDRGSYIIHTGLKENKEHDIEKLKSLGDNNLDIKDDKVEGFKPTSVDCSEELAEFRKHAQDGTHQLASSRITPSNKEAVQAAREKVKNLGERIKNKIYGHLGTIPALSKGKFGSETEGFVIHPPSADSEQDRCKYVSDAAKENMKRNKEAMFKKEGDDVHHVYVTQTPGSAGAGNSVTHIGHINDLVGSAVSLSRRHKSASVHVGVPSDNEVFSKEEIGDLMKHQVSKVLGKEGENVSYHHGSKLGGEAIISALKEARKNHPEKKLVLHIVGGHDKEDANKFYSKGWLPGAENPVREVKENPEAAPSDVHVETPNAGARMVHSSGKKYSGTLLRNLAKNGDEKGFSEMIGDHPKSNEYMKRLKEAILSGKTQVERK